jgi:hypothetical protein
MADELMVDGDGVLAHEADGDALPERSLRGASQLAAPVLLQHQPGIAHLEPAPADASCRHRATGYHKADPIDMEAKSRFDVRHVEAASRPVRRGRSSVRRHLVQIFYVSSRSATEFLHPSPLAQNS